MKNIFKHLIVVGFAIGHILELHAQGNIVPNGVVMNFGGLFSPQEIDVLHNPANPTSGGSYTGFSLDPNGKTPPSNPFVNTFSFDPVVDIGVRTFLVSPNDPVDSQSVLSLTYTELTFPNSYVFESGIPFYVGLYTGKQQSTPPNGIYNDPLFGWAELENNKGVIELLDSALEYKGGGIYAGTDSIIPSPEPATWTLMLCGAGAFACRHWTKRHGPEGTVRK